MGRDRGLEALIEEELEGLPGLSDKAMFGGRAWLLDGRLLCGARDDGMLVRLGKDHDGWALAMPGVTPMMSGPRRMPGWVWVGPQVYGRDAVRRKLLDQALAFVRTLPPK